MSVPAARPVYFGSPRPLFGWLHEPASEQRRAAGLVLCNPFGYEAVCTHRTLRTLAEVAAKAGFAVLRFDYEGTGDSAGADQDAHRWSSWLDSIGAAIDELRATTGVAEIGLFGIRLGALLAVAAAARHSSVRWLVAAAPVVSGRKYLRELRALALSASDARDAASPATPAVEEVAGYLLGAELCADLQRADALAFERNALESALVLDRSDMPGAKALLKRWTERGVSTTTLPFDDYVEMMLDPHENEVPAAMIAHTVDWLCSQVAAVAQDALPMPPVASSQPCTEFVVDAPHNIRVRETAMYFDAQRRLFGILTESDDRGAPPRRVVLMLNSGGQSHTGPNRMYVRIARMLASAGVVSARVDMSGIGDSSAPARATASIIYSAYAFNDLQEFLACLRGKFPHVPVHVLGICSGAYHSFKAAVAGYGIQGAIVINPLTFFWKDGMTLGRPEFHLTAEANRYRKTAVSASAWVKLLRGQVNLANLAATLGGHLRNLVRHRVRAIARGVGLPVADDLAAELAAAAAHGTTLSFVFADTDPGQSMLAEQAGSTARNLMRAGRLSIDIIENADHTFTARAAQDRLFVVLRSLLGARA